MSEREVGSGPVEIKPRFDSRTIDTPIESVVFVGASCAGKSSAASFLESSSTLFTIARRVTTRQRRGSDAHESIDNVSDSDFEREKNAGLFALHWRRNLVDGSSVRYACRPVAEGVPLFLGGEGIYSENSEVGPPGVLEGALLVGVFAPLDVRLSRLMHRSPELVSADGNPPAQFSHDDERMIRNVDIVLHNYGRWEPDAFRSLETVLMSLLGSD